MNIVTNCPDPNAPSMEHAMMSVGPSVATDDCQLPPAPTDFVILTYEEYAAMFDQVTMLTVVVGVLTAIIVGMVVLWYRDRQRRPKFLK